MIPWLTERVLTLACIIAALVGCVYEAPNWGWFLVVALLLIWRSP